LIIEEKISAFMGASLEYEFYEFDTVDALIAEGVYFDLIFINRALIDNMDILVKHISKEVHKKQNSRKDKHKERFGFVNYIDDPISEKDCNRALDYIRQHLEYTSMYVAVEFLTDKGLRSIAISKILYFEFYNRKIRIKTVNSEFSCDDTLRNVMSLVGSHGFYQTHKGFIVNMKHIANVKGYSITMNNGASVPVAQKKSSEFRKAYKAYLNSTMRKFTKSPGM
jgi:DNA-binding LytR/AlgR family response regulator